MTVWKECPSQGMEPIRLPETLQARCPICEFTYSTMMDDPILPRHWLNRQGDVQLRPQHPGDD